MEQDKPRFEPVTCPFCGEEDYDKVGLKMHLLNGWCPTFDTIGTQFTPATEDSP